MCPNVLLVLTMIPALLMAVRMCCLRYLAKAKEAERHARKQAKKAVSAGANSEAQQHFDEVLDIATPGRRHKKQRVTTYKKRSDLPAHLYNCMGEANKAAVAKDYDHAVNLCARIIKEAPFVPQPYTTLGMVYMEQGNLSEALRYKLLASQCMPADHVNWNELGQLSQTLNEETTALHCFQKAAKHNPEDLRARFQVCELLMKQRSARSALRQLCELLKDTDGDLKVCTALYKLSRSKDYKDYKLSRHAQLVTIARTAIWEWMESADKRKAGDGAASVARGHVKVYLELSAQLGAYNDVVDCIMKYAALCTLSSTPNANKPELRPVTTIGTTDPVTSSPGPSVAAVAPAAAATSGSPDPTVASVAASSAASVATVVVCPDSLEANSASTVAEPGQQGGISATPSHDQESPVLRTASGWVVPVDLDPYFTAQIGIAHLHLPDDGTGFAVAVLDRLATVDIASYYTLFVDVIDALLDAGFYSQAMTILGRVTALPQYDRPALWVKRARCQLELGEGAAATKLLAEVVRIVPGHKSAQALLAQARGTRCHDGTAKRKKVGISRAADAVKRSRTWKVQEQALDAKLPAVNLGELLARQRSLMANGNYAGAVAETLQACNLFCECFPRKDKGEIRGEPPPLPFPPAPPFVYNSVSQRYKQYLSRDTEGNTCALAFIPKKLPTKEWYEMISRTCACLVHEGQFGPALAILTHAVASDNLPMDLKESWVRASRASLCRAAAHLMCTAPHELCQSQAATCTRPLTCTGG